MKKSVEIQSFRAEEAKSRTIKEDAVATLQKFARVVKFSQLSTTFEFLLVSFCFLPNFSLRNSVYFVHFGILY